jgi:hypothetical protein
MPRIKETAMIANGKINRVVVNLTKAEFDSHLILNPKPRPYHKWWWGFLWPYGGIGCY